MSTTKRIDGNYTIEVTAGNVLTLNSDTLTVVGAPAFEDNTLIINDGEVGAGVTGVTAGILIDRGSETNAYIYYDDSLDKWTLDQGDGTQVEIRTGALGGGTPLENVVEDLTPQLGGDLDVNGQDITSLINTDVSIVTTGTGDVSITTAAGGKLGLSTPLVLQSGVIPTIAAGEVAIHTGADGGGGTQLHFKNDTDSGELVSKAKAIAFALIF